MRGRHAPLLRIDPAFPKIDRFRERPSHPISIAVRFRERRRMLWCGGYGDAVMRLRAVALSMGLLSAGPATSSTMPPGVTAFVNEHKLTVYTLTLADLNGDKRPDALIYAMATSDGHGQADLCGSGGCDLYVLTWTPTGYQQVTDISIARPPVRVLSTITHGWHDLGVMVAGGGIVSGYEARLRFNGRSYPANPTVPPATRSKNMAGKQVIGKEAELMPKIVP